MSDESDFYMELNQLRAFGSTCYQPWHAILQEKFELHPSVKLMVAQHRAKDPRQLAMEYPHVSEKDASRLAYTRTAADGANDRQLVTSVGKYLARHWPEVKDDLRRDVQAMYSPDTLQIFNTTPDIIRGIEDGPRSCMASIYGSIPFNEQDARQMRYWFKEPTAHAAPDWTKHPYSGYRPEYGWSIALRTTPAGQINGRALIYKDGDELVFLRTYRRHPTQSDGWSETDFTLQEWLKYQGYKMVSGWPEGAKIHTPSAAGSSIFAPYVDGELQTVRYDGNETSYFTDDDWTHQCTSTNAYPCSRDDDDDDDDDDNHSSCDDCGDRTHDNDVCRVGREGTNYVCSSCLTNYTRVYGEAPYNTHRNGRRLYHVHDDYAAYVEGQDYSVDVENPPDSIVQLEDGDWAELDDCVTIDGGYYMQGDYRVVYLQDNENLDDNFGLRADCYQVDGLWWKSEEHWAEFYGDDDEDKVIEPLTTTVAAVSDERFALAD